MNSVFKKMQLKEQNPLFIFNAPEEFRANIDEISQIRKIIIKPHKQQRFDFLLLFATKVEDIKNYAEMIESLMNEEALLWFAYPKKSSKKYKSDLYRDEGWQPLGALGLEPVRMIAIDEDWSAVRFRHVDKIKTFKRDKTMALSEKGKQRE